jgi:hypothetical protein
VEVPAGGLHPGARRDTEFEKRAAKSEFTLAADDEVSRMTAYFAAPKPKEIFGAHLLGPQHKFDGTRPAAGVTHRDTIKPVKASLHSHPDCRSSELYLQVLLQFAVGVNPRYAEDAPGKPRGHIFVWDVTRALGCAIPHFVSAREMNLTQTSDWLRNESQLHGWNRLDLNRALEMTAEGKPVLMLPRDPKLRLLGVVMPGEVGDDMKPPLAAAALLRGYQLSASAALGVYSVDYLGHE